ncbi:MAG: DEAD/DEAH box helicase, partial [Myxococcota bacterium]
CFSLAAKLGLELAAYQRVVPTVKDGRARWAALLTRPADRSRVDLLADALPAAARAEPAGTRPLRLRPSTEVLRRFLDSVVDVLYRQRAYPGPSRGWMRAWADGLRDDDASFALRDARWQAMPERIAAWAAAAEAPTPRVGFALKLPRDRDGTFPLELRLHPPGDAETSVPLVPAWRAGSAVTIGAHTYPRPAEAALRGLARAAQLHSVLRDCLAGAEPRDLSLDANQAWAFLDQGRRALEQAGFLVSLPKEFQGSGQQRLKARIRLGSRTGEPLEDALGFSWEVLVNGRVLTGDEFAEIIAADKPIVKWRKRWVFFDPADLVRLPRDLSERGSMPLPVALRAVLTGEYDGVEVIADTNLTNLIDAIREPPDLPAPERLNATLRGYQRRGYAWLSTLGELGLGALLADDMGLGKTIQLIAHLLSRADNEHLEPRPSLVVCPTSVLGNWERELARFAPALEFLRWHGHGREEESLGDVDVVLTTYGLLVRDVEQLGQIPWDIMALDEAQSIKNPDSQRAKAARQLIARQRIALTGTPVENRLEELWSVMEFLVPGLLGARRTFLREVAVPVERFGDDQVAAKLRVTVSPFLLRRVKTDPNVIDDLPDKVERREYCMLTTEQRRLYREEVDRAMEEIAQASDLERRGQVLAMLTALKQICNHPLQFLKKRVDNPDMTLPGRSGKLDRLTERIESIADCGDRAVVFTQYREMGDLLRAHLTELLSVAVPFLHGGTPIQQRDAMVRSFQEDAMAAPVLIVSLRAGGTGLNLTRATHVLHYDRWWNPAVEDQATDRAYRIGQHQTVMVHKMVCEGTLEERIDQLLDEKRELFRTVVGSGERWVTELDDDQLRALVMLAQDPKSEDHVA